MFVYRIGTSDLQIVRERCIHYASQDGLIHIQSGTGFMQLYRRYICMNPFSEIYEIYASKLNVVKN